MESQIYFNIIKLTQNAPETLAKLTADFLAIDTEFRRITSDLNNEKNLIDSNHNNRISFLRDQCRQKIKDLEDGFNSGNYITSVLLKLQDRWKSLKTTYTAVKWGGVVLGILLAFGGDLWLIGIALGILSHWLIGLLVNSTDITLSSFIHARKEFYTAQDQSQIKSINDDAKTAVIAQASIERKNIDDFIHAAENEMNNSISKKNAEYETKIREFENKKRITISKLDIDSRNKIDKTKDLLSTLVFELDKLPELFNSNGISWDSEKVFKAKDLVATNFRLGSEQISINLDGKKSSIDVPRCIPFLNKSNLVFNCNDQKETKEAIRISHNIIARTLLSLQASKTKITFIDPLELGGNAAPFTPLLREIYGGMVFTQHNDIENQLSILTRAIENVIQKYLQDKYKDIADYNEKTKEVAEPYRLLIVYNFPHGFNDTTAGKLLNIIKSGPRAGIHTILVNDKNGKLPYGMSWDSFNSANLTEINLNINNGQRQNEIDGIINDTAKTPKIGEIYKGVIKRIAEVGAFVEFLPGKEGMVHISEISEERLESMDGICEIGDEWDVKLLDIKSAGTFKLSRKAAKEQLKIEKKIIEKLGKSATLIIDEGTNSLAYRHFAFDNNLPYNTIVDFVNKELPNTSSVKVPFTKYIDPKEKWWKEKAHKRFAVPIGRHALEVQNLQFDNDDDNQALLIGKPGSGKSNLLHVIIANSIWKYSPDQLEIYLIDFKGGVEFTIYADKKIPHIRTIAIESEREFGLSVLDGVEKELVRRESEFSKTGVQNIEQFHENFPDVRMPRVMLIVDEFQEFYAEDDNIKQAVDDKFDRIVRKGRAFGINTLFSSQTLSGNSIKKSTKELIDIRIALMCSDLDANQILDDRNPAARDLTRPGEGIYNPENGKVEGNMRFQAFFIEKNDLINTIESVVEFAKTNENGQSKFKQIIFRGSEKAQLEKENHPLNQISPTVAPKSLRLWLGEPVAIAEDITAILRKQGGSNLIVAGYDESIGVRIMCSSIISIAAQHQSNTAKFYAFNFYNVDSELVDIPVELFRNIQQECKTVNNREVKEVLESIKEEIERRLSGNGEPVGNIYLTLFSMQRGRALRKNDWAMSDEGNLIAFILKEGADVGVYVLLQVDTMDNFTKSLDDNLLKEFSQRVASQMNPDNSVKLIGNQKASKLGTNRAWYYDDNENTMIKFKPYELPAYTWVAQLQSKPSILS